MACRTDLKVGFGTDVGVSVQIVKSLSSRYYGLSSGHQNKKTQPMGHKRASSGLRFAKKGDDNAMQTMIKMVVPQRMDPLSSRVNSSAERPTKTRVDLAICSCWFVPSGCFICIVLVGRCASLVASEMGTFCMCKFVALCVLEGC